METVILNNVQQFAKLVKDCGGKFVLSSTFTPAIEKRNRSNRYGCSEVKLTWDAVAVLPGFDNGTKLTLDLSHLIPDGMRIVNFRKGLLQATKSAKKEVVEILKDLEVPAEELKKLTRVTMKDMKELVNASNLDEDENNFEHLIKAQRKATTAEFTTPHGKLTMTLETAEGYHRNGPMTFKLELDWSKKLEELMVEAEKEITAQGLELLQGYVS